MSSSTERGHRSAPHTADTILEAWGPTPEACLEEAVAGFAAIFVDVDSVTRTEPRPFRVGPAQPAGLLVRLLEEALALVDIAAVVPVAATIELEDGEMAAGTFAVVPAHEVEVVGPVPKGVSYHLLEFGRQGGAWRCRATVDV